MQKPTTEQILIIDSIPVPIAINDDDFNYPCSDILYKVLPLYVTTFVNPLYTCGIP